MLETHLRYFRGGMLALAAGAIFASGVVSASVVLPQKRITDGTIEALNSLNQGRTGLTFNYVPNVDSSSGQRGVFSVMAASASGLTQEVNILPAGSGLPTGMPSATMHVNVFGEGQFDPPAPIFTLTSFDPPAPIHNFDPPAPIRSYTITVRSAAEFNALFTLMDEQGQPLQVCSATAPDYTH